MKSLVVVKLIIALTGGTPHVESFTICQEDTGSQVEVQAKAEIDASSFVKSLETALSNSLGSSSVASDTELPRWLTDQTESGKEKNGDYSFLVVTIPQADLVASHDELREKLQTEARSFIDQNILRHVYSSDVPFLTNDYIEKEILSVNPERVFTKTLVRPGGEMFQIYRQLTIPAVVVKKLVDFERSIVAGERSIQVGLAAAALLGMVGVMSGLVGFMAQREKPKA